jgi:hypothetical protein
MEALGKIDRDGRFSELLATSKFCKFIFLCFFYFQYGKQKSPFAVSVQVAKVTSKSKQMSFMVIGRWEIFVSAITVAHIRCLLKRAIDSFI